MSTTQETTPTDPIDETAATTEVEKVDEIDWKAQSRKWEARAKENRDAARANEAAARELEEIKQAQMSELEKAQQEAQAEKERADALQAERDRLAVIAKHQIPAEYSSLIDDGNLEEKAELVKQLMAADREKTAAPTVPALNRPLPASMSSVSTADQLRAASTAGDSEATMRLKLLQLSQTN